MIKIDEKCILESERYIRWISRKYNVINESDREDLYQEGVLSLYSAAANYKDGSSAGFLSYADRYIKNSMNLYIQRNSGIVRYLGRKGRRNLFANSSKIDFDNCDISEIKVRYKCSDEDIRDVRSMGTVYLNSDDIDFELSDDIDILGEMISEEEWELYRSSYGILTDRELDIIRSRLSGVTLKELSDRYGISMERVRQVEVGGIKKMSDYINGLVI